MPLEVTPGGLLGVWDVVRRLRQNCRNQQRGRSWHLSPEVRKQPPPRCLPRTLDPAGTSSVATSQPAYRGAAGLPALCTASPPRRGADHRGVPRGGEGLQDAELSLPTC